MKQLITRFGISRKTLHNWISKWENENFIGLYDKAGRGRKSRFKEEQKQQIREWAKAEPKNLKKVLVKVKTEWEITVSKDTIKRILKKFEMKMIFFSLELIVTN